MRYVALVFSYVRANMDAISAITMYTERLENQEMRNP